MVGLKLVAVTELSYIMVYGCSITEVFKIALIALLVVGCASTGPVPPEKARHAMRHAGEQPQNYRETIAGYLKYKLADPYSIRDLDIGEPILSCCTTDGFKRYCGWMVPVQFNAKNKFGGYVGINLHYFWFHGERLELVNGSPTFCPQAMSYRMYRVLCKVNPANCGVMGGL